MKRYKKRIVALTLASLVTIAGSFASDNYKNSLTDDQNIIYCFLKEIVCLINKIQNETKYNVEENVLKAMRLINSGMSNVEVYILLDLKEYEIKIVEQFINEDKKLLKNVYLSMM